MSEMHDPLIDAELLPATELRLKLFAELRLQSGLNHSLLVGKQSVAQTREEKVRREEQQLHCLIPFSIALQAHAGQITNYGNALYLVR